MSEADKGGQSKLAACCSVFRRVKCVRMYCREKRPLPPFLANWARRSTRANGSCVWWAAANRIILQAVRFVQVDRELARPVLPLVELAQDISKRRRHNTFTTPCPGAALVSITAGLPLLPRRRQTPVPRQDGPPSRNYSARFRVQNTVRACGSLRVQSRCPTATFRPPA